MKVSGTRSIGVSDSDRFWGFVERKRSFLRILVNPGTILSQNPERSFIHNEQKAYPERSKRYPEQAKRYPERENGYPERENGYPERANR